MGAIFENIINSEISEENKFTVALFCFPIILQSDNTFPLRIVSFAFEILHESLAKQTFPVEQWEKLEKRLPEVAWYNRWDKCKKLRKDVKRKSYKLKAIEQEENSDIDIHLL